MSISVKSGEFGPIATCAYLLVNDETREAVAIDAPFEFAEFVNEECRKHSVKLVALILTHTHWDHTGDAATLVRKHDCVVYCHPADVYRLTEPDNHTVWPLPFSLEPVREVVELQHGSIISKAGIYLEIRHTPGHTEGGVCIIDHSNRKVWVGDTLFAGSIGRTDLPGGDQEELLESIHRELFSLEDDYGVYPGHGPTSTIGRERLLNPFLT